MLEHRQTLMHNIRQEVGAVGQLETVNMIKTKDGYTEQSKVDQKDLEKMSEKMADRFMRYFNCEREQTV